MTTKATIIKDRVMGYIRHEMRGGPVFGLHLEDAALPVMGCAASTLGTRLRQLRAAGFLSQERRFMGTSQKRLVAYTCSAEQYAAWVERRGAATAFNAENAKPAENDHGTAPTALKGAGCRLFDNTPPAHHGTAILGRRG